MLNQITNAPPATHVLRPERKDIKPGFWDNVLHRITGSITHVLRERHSRDPGFVSKVNAYGQPLETGSDADLKTEADRLRKQFHLAGFQEELVARSFALIREVALRTVNQRHFDTQLLGGRVLLHGMVAEMETGEGKTLTATLPAATAALAGVPVHVITVNDYLTGRDAEWMGSIYKALGLSVGCIIHDIPHEERRAAYDCDVTYCTNKEITFDYLRDRIVLGGSRNSMRLQSEYLYGQGARVRKLLLRGLHFGIVDEADSILIDEARTPLIISKGTGSEGERSFLEQAMTIAEEMKLGTDYKIDNGSRKIKLTDGGKSRIREWVKSMGPLWAGTVRREEIVSMALSANHFFNRDEQYLVRDDKVQIIDEFTGRVMADRSYERGLHQLIEVKEGCEITQQHETQARISYQRFFRRYLHLAGMTGTAKEVKRELRSVYNLSVVYIPTHRKMVRKAYADRILPTEKEKWNVVLDKICELHEKKRPVLVATRSVSASEKASLLLDDKGLTYQVLNAKQDAEEADIVSRAGAPGCITIATNMAGRGTDIKLSPGVEELQGLHVILTERHEAGRIDRQLAGRCGRMGDPGSHGAILSLEDPILEGGRGGVAALAARKFIRPDSIIWKWLARIAVLSAQKKIERLHARIRKSLLNEDERRGDMLSFSGRSE